MNLQDGDSTHVYESELYTGTTMTDGNTINTDDLEHNISNIVVAAGGDTDIDSNSTDNNFNIKATNNIVYIETNDTAYKNFTFGQSVYVNSQARIYQINSSDNKASGAIKQVYTLENLARAVVDRYMTIGFDFNETVSTGDPTTASTVNNAYLEINVSRFGASASKFVIRYGFIGSSANENTYSFGGYDVNISSAKANNATEINISVPAADLNKTTASQDASILAYGINKYFTDINSSAAYISATAVGNTVYITGDIDLDATVILANQDDTAGDGDMNISYIGGGVDAASDPLTLSESHILLKESNLTIPAITDNLGYVPVSADIRSNDIESGVPLIQNLVGKKVRKILTTNENADDGSISWSFIDLSKSPSDWFDQKDGYDLFSFDKTKGYWVYIENTEPTTNFGDLTQATTTLTLIYDHYFTGFVSATSTQNYTTTNAIKRGILTVDIGNTGMDTTAIDKVYANIGGHKIELTQSGNQYTGEFSEYDLGELTGDTVDVNITFFDTDRFGKTVSLSFDNAAPVRPTVDLSGKTDLTNLTLTSSSDTMYFYAYSGEINNSSPASGGTLAEANISDNPGTASATATVNLCAMAPSFNTNMGDFRFIAIDYDTASSVGYEGQIDYNRVSDIGYLVDYNSTFYPVYKNASILAPKDGESASVPYDFNSSCENPNGSGTQASTDHGVEVADESDGATILVAYPTGDSEFSTTAAADLKELDINVSGTKIAHVKFDSSTYTGSQVFLLYYNSKIYSTTFGILSANDGGSVNLTDENVTMFPGQIIDSQKK
jgi:hypothetical protein